VTSRVERNIDSVIARIDLMINAQVNVILHHDAFQQLEASWRGVLQLTEQSWRDGQVKVRLLDLSYDELSKDLLNASDFDQSMLFEKCYSEEFDQPGGEPYGLFVGDYYFCHRPSNDRADGVSLLREISKIAAACYAPFLAGASPALFGLDDFSEFKPSLIFESVFKMREYKRWTALRNEDDVRFIGLTIPRYVIRKPYNQDGVKLSHSWFAEIADHASDYLWANAAYAYASVVIDTFSRDGWFSEIQGLNPKTGLGGVVPGLDRQYFSTDRLGAMPKMITETLITDDQERRLSDYGFIALKDHPGSEKSVFYSSRSLQLARRYDRLTASANAKISSMLHYVLCISRFAHFIKVLARNKIGSFASAADCEAYLQRWLQQYCSQADFQESDMRAKYPLREGLVKLQEKPGRPGEYFCVMHLKPHYQIDSIESQLRLVTPVAV
jgi:type VI secretion system protein ImpD